MSDEERVSDLFGRLTARGVDLDDGDLNLIVEAFAAVRLEERRAIVTWLRERASVPFSTHEQRDVGSVYAASLLGEADRIERGEHEEHVS